MHKLSSQTETEVNLSSSKTVPLILIYIEFLQQQCEHIQKIIPNQGEPDQMTEFL